MTRPRHELTIAGVRDAVGEKPIPQPREGRDSNAQIRVPATPNTEATTIDKLLYRVPEAAAALSLSRAKVYELIRSGDLPSIRIDGSRRVKADDLRAYVAALGMTA